MIDHAAGTLGEGKRRAHALNAGGKPAKQGIVGLADERRCFLDRFGEGDVLASDLRAARRQLAFEAADRPPASVLEDLQRAVVILDFEIVAQHAAKRTSYVFEHFMHFALARGLARARILHAVRTPSRSARRKHGRDRNSTPGTKPVAPGSSANWPRLQAALPVLKAGATSPTPPSMLRQRLEQPRDETMPTGDGSWANILGILLIFVLVAANGFFVAAEFALVAVRPSRVAQLVAEGRARARALKRATDNLDACLAATQLGITISSLALGWIGEPALAHLIEPLLAGLGSFAVAGSHAIAVTIAFTIITALHIVLGELAPKSLALQRTEATALWVVRPLGVFLFLLRPTILALNGLGNLLLRLIGLKPAAAEESLHSPEELKLLIAASEQAGLLRHEQLELVSRVLSIGDRPIGDIMTPRVDVDWIDLGDGRDEILKDIRACRHEQ